MARDYTAVYSTSQLGDGVLAASAEGRAKMAAGFVVGSHLADAAATSAKMAPTHRKATGTSTTGTGGTVLDVQAADGCKFVAWELWYDANASPSNVSVTLHFSDGTSELVRNNVNVDNERMTELGWGAPYGTDAYRTAANIAKDVTRVVVTTAGGGANQRKAYFQGLEVHQ